MLPLRCCSVSIRHSVRVHREEDNEFEEGTLELRSTYQFKALAHRDLGRPGSRRYLLDPYLSTFEIVKYTVHENPIIDEAYLGFAEQRNASIIHRHFQLCATPKSA